MPRANRVSVGGTLYHVINRANNRDCIFLKDADYAYFESLLRDAKEFTGMRIVAYCIMPNHWHLLLYPRNDGDMGVFMHWLTTTHVRAYREWTQTVGYGHVYQGTYKSFPVETGAYALTVLRYIEQNPLRARLVTCSEDWRWGSAWRRVRGGESERQLLDVPPIEVPEDYRLFVNTLDTVDVTDQVRQSVNTGFPFGNDEWVRTFAKHRSGVRVDA